MDYNDRVELYRSIVERKQDIEEKINALTYEMIHGDNANALDRKEQILELELMESAAQEELDEFVIVKKNDGEWVDTSIEWEEILMEDGEHLITSGNRDYITRLPDWYNNYEYLAGQLSYYCDREDVIPELIRYWYCGEDKLTDEQKTAVLEWWDNGSDDLEDVLKLQSILTGDTWEECTMRGYSQGDWQTLYYNQDLINDVDYIESVYMGKLTEYIVDGTTVTLTDDDAWEHEHNNTIAEYVAAEWGLDGSKAIMYEDIEDIADVA